MIDLVQLQLYVTLIKDCITILSTATIAIIAIIGLTTWKKQLKGKTEYELARRLLRAVYEVRDAIGAVRNPFASAAEISISLQEANIEIEPRDPEFNAKSQSALYQRRWKKVQEALGELDLEEFEAEVIWGHGIKEKILVLRRQVVKLYSYIHLYLTAIQNPDKVILREGNAENVEEVIYDFHDLIKDNSNNAFTLKTVEAIEQIESFLKPFMKL
jgi:hypothetical protein